MRNWGLLLLAVTLLLTGLTSCDDQLPGLGKLEIQLYTQAIADAIADNQDYLSDEGWELYSLIQISGLDQEFYIGNKEGVITVNNLPPGIYNIHPVFLDTSTDFTIESVADETTSKTVIIPDMRLEYYAVNPSAITDLNFRLELAKAIDRETIMADLSDDSTTYDPLYQMLPSAMMNDGLALNTSIQEATNLLDSEEPFDFSISFNSLDNNFHQTLATTIKNSWELYPEVGTVGLDELSWSDLSIKRNDLSFDLLRSGWLMDSNNPIAFLKYVLDMVGYSSTEYDVIKSALETAHTNALLNYDYMTAEDYIGYTNQLHDLLLNEGLAIPLYEQ